MAQDKQYGEFLYALVILKPFLKIDFLLKTLQTIDSLAV